MLNIFMQSSGSVKQAFDPSFMIMMTLMFAVFYFLLIRPQNKRLKDHKAMEAAVTRGDTVVTSGGLIGKVTKVEDGELTIDIGSGNKVKVVASMLADVRNKTAPAANDKGKK